MVYGSEMWNVKTVEGILRRTERAMIQKVCGVKISDTKNTCKLMERLCLEETVVEVIQRSGLRWMGHVLRREDDEPVRREWDVKYNLALSFFYVSIYIYKLEINMINMHLSEAK